MSHTYEHSGRVLRRLPAVSFSAGFTLLEIIAAIAVMALIVGLAVTRMNRYLEWDMKKTSNRLASTMRYLYDKSATEGLYIRLVMDLDEQTYWVEATRDPVLMTSQEQQKKMDEARKKAEEDARREQPPPVSTARSDAVKTKAEVMVQPATKIIPREPSFSKLEQRLLKPTRLPDLVFFKDVYVEHEPLPVERGRVAIHFFPNGTVEEAVINLRDEDDEVFYSLATDAVAGRINVESRYREPDWGNTRRSR